MFSSPVLSVAQDAVRDIDGGIALSGLCTLFSKCKASLQDGPRLENISWRLWHREMVVLTHNYNYNGPPTPPPQSNLPPFLPAEKSASKAPFTFCPTETHNQSQASQFSLTPSPKTNRSSHPHSLALLDVRRPNIGKIICDILPHQIPPREKHSTTMPIPTLPTSSVKGSSLPTPKAENESFHSYHMSTQQATTITPSTNERLDPNTSSIRPSSNTDRQHRASPNVIVVDPTPNPTPHLTPPTSPVIATACGTAPLLPKSPHTPTQSPSQPRIAPTLEPSFLLPPPTHTNSYNHQSIPSAPSKANLPTPTEESLKPSDRRFFLQHSPEGDEPPERVVATSATVTAIVAVGASGKAEADASVSVAVSAGSGSARGRARGSSSNSASRSASTFSSNQKRTSSSSSSVLVLAKSKTGAKGRGKEMLRPRSHHAIHPQRQQKERGGVRGKGGRDCRERGAKDEPASHGSDGAFAVATTSAAGGGGGGGTLDACKVRAMFNIGVIGVENPNRKGCNEPERALTRGEGGSKGRTPDLIAPAKVIREDCSSQLRQAQAQQQLRRRVVVTSTSSECESTDEEEDSWASEDMTDGELERIVNGEENPNQTQTEIVHTTAATAATVITTTATTTTTSSTSKKKTVITSKASHSNDSQQQLLEEAALEAQRQRALFAKVPVTQRPSSPSKANVGNNGIGGRTKSGLLSLLMNPDPEIFPPGHPYRTSFSSADFSLLRGGGGNGGPGPNSWRVRAPPVLQTSKSAAALPVAAQVNALGAGEKGHKPKGRPEGQEMEEDSESEEENGEDAIQLSRSVAHQRLALLVAGKRAEMSNVITNANETPSQPLLPQRPALATVTTAPIPLVHPYNLPAPAPPSTPRTTRRQMLQTELSESLRRNLLWERKVSNVVMRAGGRRQSSSGVLTGGGGGIGGLRPLTTMNADARGEGEGGKREEGVLAAIVRHRSWADDYHTSGW